MMILLWTIYTLRKYKIGRICHNDKLLMALGTRAFTWTMLEYFPLGWGLLRLGITMLLCSDIELSYIVFFYGKGGRERHGKWKYGKGVWEMGYGQTGSWARGYGKGDMGKGHMGKRDHGQGVGDMGKGDLN